MTAMTAMTLDALSGGRFVIGLGPSGAQVVEGWYGVPYGKPLTRTREYVEIIRKILKREEKLTHEGEHYSIPNTGPGTTGMGKPLKSILHGRPDMKIYTAAISPNGVRCAAEVADGFFPLWMNPERFDDFDVAPMVTVIPGDDLDQCRVPVKAMLSLYIGGMGSRKKNFYNDYASRMGYEAEAKQIQDLFLDGKKKEALAAVPDKLVDEIALVGPADRIRDRLGAWKDASAKGHVGTLLVGGGIEGIRLLAEEVL
jgi:alkanesulfonate monooxygenase SsuD/methylene tetrahydromethanopterin reductase-like flavin-dependent oxidoreductase (luciferase family)